MRIGVSSYSFSQAMRDGRMTILDVIPTAKGMGYEGVEIVKFCSDEEMREYAPQARGAVQRIRDAHHRLHGRRGFPGERRSRAGRNAEKRSRNRGDAGRAPHAARRYRRQGRHR